MRVVMLLHRSATYDSRVRREARALVEAGHEVTVLELAPVPPDSERLDGFRRRSVLPPGWVRRMMPLQTYRLAFVATFVRGVAAERPDAIHAHDAAMLLPGLIARRLTGAALVYDSHELATGVPYRDRRWMLFVRIIEAVAAPRCAAVITVSDGIAERLREAYDLAVAPAVVRNVADAPARRDATGRLRRALGIGRAPLVLHQGSAAPGRGADVLVRAMAHLADAHLVFLGVNGGEGQALIDAAHRGRVEDRVHVLAPVPPDELLEWTADADVGVSLLEDSCDNHRLALPNKLFEYVGAGVPVVVSDLPELRKFVDREGVGYVADPRDPRAVAASVSRVLGAGKEELLHDRVSAAGERLCWRIERERLLTLYRDLAGRQSAQLERTYLGYSGDAAKQRAWRADNRGNRAMRAELLTHLLAAGGRRLDRGADVLDVGCGTGWLLQALVDRGLDPSRLTGVDALENRANHAREAVPGATILHADAASLPLESASFDLVFLITVLSSTVGAATRSGILRECARLVRPGGFVLIYDTRVPNPLNDATRAVGLRQIRAAGLTITARRSLTVAPPVARRLGPRTERLYPLLAAVPLIRSHRLIVARPAEFTASDPK